MFAIRFLLEGTFDFAFLLFEVLGTCQKPLIIVSGGEGILPGKRNPHLRIIPSNGANQQGGGVSDGCFGWFLVENNSCQAPRNTLKEENAEKAFGAFSYE